MADYRLDDILPKMQWKKLDINYEGSSSYQGEYQQYRIVVVEFSIENQGFPPGSKGYDGVVVAGTTVIHLTRELAKKAFDVAKKRG